MNKLISTSKILYDNDISNKMKEITELKEEYKPEIIYSSHDEWKENKEKAFLIISNYINRWKSRVSPIGADGHWQKYPTDVVWLFDGICESLNLITKNKYKTWCHSQAWIIATGIIGLIIGLQKTGNLLLIWEDIGEIIYNFITEQLICTNDRTGYGYGGILSEICIICDENGEKIIL